MTELGRRIADLGSHIDAATTRLANEVTAIKDLLGGLQNDATTQGASLEDSEAIDVLEARIAALEPKPEVHAEHHKAKTRHKETK